MRIVSAGTLDTLLNQAQAQLQQALVRLREQQREARGKVEPAEKQWRQKGRLRPEDVDKLLQAEQLQQQIRGRIGSNQEGLRAEVAKILQTLRDNQLRRSDTHERMQTVAAELERLAREELEQIEPLLTEARKQSEITGQLGPEKARQAAQQEQQVRDKEADSFSRRP